VKNSTGVISFSDNLRSCHLPGCVATLLMLRLSYNLESKLTAQQGYRKTAAATNMRSRQLHRVPQ